MFPNGTIVSIVDGIPKKASKQEQVEHLSSLLPKTYKDEAIEHIMFNPKDGCVYGKTASRTIKKVVAQQATHHQEPVDGVQKEKSTKVPRKPEKAKPETGKVTKDRPDVGKPTEVRQDGYQRGSGGEDLHTDVVPRSSDDGVGGKKTKFEKEKGDKATSGNPDSYVQKFEDGEKPAAAGSEENHAASHDIQINNDQLIYQNLKLSGKDEKGVCDGTGKEEGGKGINCKDKEDDKDDKNNKDDKDEKKDDKKKGKLPPWLDKNNKDGEEKEASVDAEELKEALAEIEAKDIELNSLKLQAERTKEATAYALSLLKLNPAKYANTETFTSFIQATVEAMSIESIKTATEETKVLLAEKQRIDESVIKSAVIDGRDSVEAGVVTVLNTIDPEEERFSKAASNSDIKNVLMSGTRLGRAMEGYETYVPSEPR